MSAEQLTVAVVGAGGKMGMRVSRNLQKSSHNVFYSENSPPARNASAPKAATSPAPTTPLRPPTW